MERQYKHKENDDSDSNDSEKNIITEIYKSTFEQQQQQILLNSQLSNGIDQYTLHSFSYLHPIAKPPLAEYTSITDCIDTSTLDRPPSPPILSFNTKSSNNTFDIKNPSMPINKLVNATKSYCSSESARSAVARQESEILRLAEESQHVIISQMLNKIVKKSDFLSSDTNQSHENDNKTCLDSQEINGHDPNITSSSSTQNLEMNENATQNPHRFTIETSSKESLANNEIKDSKENIEMMSTLCNEENETRHNAETLTELLNKKRKKSQLSVTNVQKKKISPEIPLHAIDRKSSQIFYAQSQAKALCMHLDDEKEEDYDDDDDDASSNKNEKTEDEHKL